MPKTTKSSNESIVDTICQLAKAQDKHRLTELLESNCIGLVHNNESAIQRLARAGDEVAVGFLLTHFDANINAALLGAAQAANLPLIGKLLARGALVCYALVGAVQSNHGNLVAELLSKGPVNIEPAIQAAASKPELAQLYTQLLADTNNPHPNWQNVALIGACEHNNKARIDELLQDGGSIIFGVLGAAAGNQTQLLDQLLTHSLTANIETKDLLDNALMGASLNYSPQLYNKLINEGADVAAAAQGLAESGNANILFQQLEAIKNDDIKTAFLNEAAKAAGLGGHVDLIKKLIAKGANPDEALRGAAENGHILLINEFSEYLTGQVRNDLIEQFKVGKVINSNNNEMLRLASFIEDPDLRNSFLKACVNQNTIVNDDRSQQIDTLSKKAKFINKLMHEHDLNYNQAFAWNLQGMHQWLLRRPDSSSIFNPVPDDVSEIIRNFIAPLTKDELNDLVKKMKFNHLKIRAEHQTKFKTPSEQTKPDDFEEPSTGANIK